MRVDVAAISDTGLVREANEDSFLVDKDIFIFAVADGMGGHVAGEIASATAIEALRAGISAGIGIESSIRNAHAAVKKKAQADTELSGMGTTITALGFSSENQLVIAHVGDSRAYVLHREILDDTHDNETELVRITKDHSLVEELVEAGQITEEEANVHPRRSVITRALGIEGEVEVDMTPIPFLKGDRYLLCSDGLTSMVRDEEISTVLKNEKSPSECARELVSRANKAGGTDNITVMIIDVIDPEVKIPNHTSIAHSIPADPETKPPIYTKGRFTFSLRIFIGFMIVVGLFTGAYLTAKNYAQQGFYLDERAGQVVLMKGREGGVLWWEPEVNSQTGIEIKNLSSADRMLVTRHETYSSRKAALARLEQIRKRQQDQVTTTTTTLPISGTTTSIPAPISLPPATSVSNG